MSKEKTEKLVLPKEVRLMMVSFLESQNIIDADAKSDDEILKEYNACVLNMQSKVTNYEASAETKSINQYLGMCENLRVTDKEFLMRLYRLNIPSFYLHLFKNDHKDLTDRELWLIVNKSGINPIKESNALFKMNRSPVKPRVI